MPNALAKLCFARLVKRSFTEVRSQAELGTEVKKRRESRNPGQRLSFFRDFVISFSENGLGIPQIDS
jgi:hypothetical protein